MSIIKIEDKINNFLKKLKSLNDLTDVYNQLHVSSSNSKIVYNLLKINTTFNWLRPILLSINYPNYKLTKLWQNY